MRVLKKIPKSSTYPKSFVQAFHSLGFPNFDACIQHTLVSFIVSLDLKPRLDHCQGVQGAPNAEGTHHAQGKELALVHHLPLDCA